MMLDPFDYGDCRPANYGLNPDFVRAVLARRQEAEEAAQRQRQTDSRQALAEALRNGAGRKAGGGRSAGAKAWKRAQRAIAAESEREAKVAAILAGMAENRIMAASVLDMAATLTGVSRDVITGGTRARDIVALRWDVIALIKLLRPDYSLPQIGRAIGGRDHTTVLWAIRQRGWTGTGWNGGKPSLANAILWRIAAEGEVQ